MKAKKAAKATKPKKKIVDKKIAVAATPGEVWKALTTADGLPQWFPLEAAVKPGEGGEVTVSWGESMSVGMKIEAWEPEKRLRLGGAGPDGSPIIQEWTIEKRGRKTMVRVVQSSFVGGSEWDKEFYDSTSYGWGFMLTNLRQYLERHGGEKRMVAWARHAVSGTRAEAYRKLLGREGIFLEGAALTEGKRYALATATGEKWSGRVEFVKRPRGFCVTVEELKDALAWLTIEGITGQHEAQLWFSTYGLGKDVVQNLETEWKAQFQRVFGDQPQGG